MKLIIEISDRNPYREIRRVDLKKLSDAPVVGDTIIWEHESYIVKYRLIDYDDSIVVIKAAR